MLRNTLLLAVFCIHVRRKLPAATPSGDTEDFIYDTEHPPTLNYREFKMRTMKIALMEALKSNDAEGTARRRRVER